MNDKIKKYAKNAGFGLSSAAIIFLYTTFTPKSDYNKLENKVNLTRDDVITIKASLSVLRSIEGKKWE